MNLAPSLRKIRLKVLPLEVAGMYFDKYVVNVAEWPFERYKDTWLRAWTRQIRLKQINA